MFNKILLVQRLGLRHQSKSTQRTFQQDFLALQTGVVQIFGSYTFNRERKEYISVRKCIISYFC